MYWEIDPAVECHSGFSNCDYPKAVQQEGQRGSVKAIIIEWRTPAEKRYHLLITGNQFLKAVPNYNKNTWKVESI